MFGIYNLRNLALLAESGYFGGMKSLLFKNPRERKLWEEAQRAARIRQRSEFKERMLSNLEAESTVNPYDRVQSPQAPR